MDENASSAPIIDLGIATSNCTKSVIGAKIKFTIDRASPNNWKNGRNAVATSANVPLSLSIVAWNLSAIVCASNLSANSCLPKAIKSFLVLPCISCLNKISDN